ncbi:armadillo-type protein [Protomyces lactucae-debilis]|uniref:Armadillo-type protein n=1 Tax=Protomyces lactucae-debilis TaxID=2754530 RepID=A0A1Y2ET51_PROLT|nr:armadillo-type protein [Protomyces lactucae-debilis]ORY74336.1 armadillo-type protein [Protomyces lactucae-debilis]
MNSDGASAAGGRTPVSVGKFDKTRDFLGPRRFTTDVLAETPSTIPLEHTRQTLNAKDRLLEQKRAEHELARQEHRRRFEEQMQMLDMKQRRDEDLLLGVDEEALPTMFSTYPVTPLRTPAQSESRSRAETLAKGTPPLKVFEQQQQQQRGTGNEQLATPPADHTGLNNGISPRSFGAKSVPGSRRQSLSTAFESLAVSERKQDMEGRRLSYIDNARHFEVPNPTDEVPVKSYLQLNTTDDSFPILVRKDSMQTLPQGPAATTDFQDYKQSFNAMPPFKTQNAARGVPVSYAQKDMHDDLRSARQAHEFKMPPGQAKQRDFQSANERGRFATMPSGTRSPLGSLPMLPAGSHSPMDSPNLYAQFGMMPQSNWQAGGFPQYSFSMHNPAYQAQETRLPGQSFAKGGAPFYAKRPAEDTNRYADVALESLVGDIFTLCKDQHGCRYLQKKLDERIPANVDLIFAETYMHAAELMIDPFGNYLCQKLLEHCDEGQRFKIVQNVAPNLINISLNMHGTRAVQKMIEFLHTPEQIKLATSALNANAVLLIKDLNGNHVIQKCLNRLNSEEAQFIFDAVAKNCVEVATHRHGCCVLQRCIDHASDAQKVQIIKQIDAHAPLLVQDPFGNYVVQYVLDLGEARFSDSLIKRFVGSVCVFSVQKFSSNVIEKCLRVAEPSIRAQLIEELLNKSRLEKLLRDSYANYVVQTALDYADPKQRQELVECLRPLLPAIRSTPYGRRIQSKISGTHGAPGFSDLPNYNAMGNFPAYGFGYGHNAPAQHAHHMPTHGLPTGTNMGQRFNADYEFKGFPV